MEDRTQRPATGLRIADLSKLASEIKAMSQHNDMTAVAVAGPPGSGKSSVAEALHEIESDSLSSAVGDRLEAWLAQRRS